MLPQSRSGSCLTPLFINFIFIVFIEANPEKVGNGA